jgi:glycosyltransferase involved in cell wall biosynthesis
MKVGFISPSTKTGEDAYGKYLKQGLLEKKVEITEFDNFILNKPNLKIFFGSLMLKRLINKNIDVLHNLDNLGPFLFKNCPNIKKISTIHDIAPVVLPDIHNNIMKFDFGYILPILIKNSDFIIVPSKSTKKDIISHFNFEKNNIEIIPYGINTTFFNPKTPKKEILNKYGIPKDYIMYVGTDNPRKNLKNLMRAFSTILNEINHSLVLIGPINKKNLIKFVKKHHNSHYSQKLLSRIIMPGYVDYIDLPVLYSGANVFIFPSLYEGFGFPPLEAMACGTPVVASNNSSISEVVSDAGIYIKNPLDQDEISKSILKLIENEKLKTKLKNKGYKRVKQYNWETTTEKTIKLYERVLEI